MTFAGKKLQGIYDSASQKLNEIGSELSDHLAAVVTRHSETSRNNEIESSTKINQYANELEAELRRFSKDSTERLQRVIENEIRETDDHVKTIINDITHLANNLKATIVDLRESYEENVQHLCSGLSAQYEGTVEETRIEVEMQDYASSKQLKAHATFLVNSMQQKLDHILWETRGNEKQASGSLFKTFMQKANQIDTHFSQLMKRLSDDFQDRFNNLEAICQSGEKGLDGEMGGLKSELDRIAVEIEEQVKNTFASALESQNKNLDNTLTNIANDLSSLHEATTEKLSEQTRELGSNLTTASDNAQTSLRIKCMELQSHVDSMLRAFTQRLDGRLNDSVSLRKNLEDEKTRIFGAILSDLSKTKEGFEKQLQQVLTESIKRVTNTGEEAEKQIISAQKRCQIQLDKESDTAKEDIDKTIRELLACVAEQKRNALTEIAKAAKGKPESN
jgi:ribosomal protein L12E/L44/L45/RPP1/RPP2